MHIRDEKIKTILLESGILDEKTFKTAANEAFRMGQSVIDVLVGREDITEDYLIELLEPHFGIKSIDLKTISIPQETLFLLPENYAKENKVVLFSFDKDKKEAKLAMVDPLDYDTIEFIRVQLDAVVLPFFTSSASLKYVLKQYKQKIGLEFNQIVEENIKKAQTLGNSTDISKIAEALPIVAILDSIIDNAMAMNASDIHFEPLEKKILVRYRVDGIMQEILSMPKVIAPILVARVKILAHMQVDEHRVPQDGRFRFEVGEQGVLDMRVNIMPVFNGEKVEMRLLKHSSKPLSLSELGFNNLDSEIILNEIKKPHGMILVTGPTGHGKTTSLYAILNLLNTPKVNITTIEDPIEYEVGRINQTQVNAKAGITFANGLRSLLRQNPDIIMIGEIRDNETAEIAIHAALTGHLVLSSLHTNDAPSAVPRFLDMGAQPFLLSSTLNLIIAQRLVRKICTSCAQSYSITDREKEQIEKQISGETTLRNIEIPKTLFRGRGCKVCGNSGFSGQIGIFEILKATDSIRKMIAEKASARSIKNEALNQGMRTMFEDGMGKVEKGITSIEEVLRVVRE